MSLPGRTVGKSAPRWGLFCLAFIAWTRLLPAQTPHHGRQFVGLDNFSEFTVARGELPGDLVFLSPEIVTDIRWNELIVSWNVNREGTLKIEARTAYSGRSTRFYTLGIWSGSTTDHQRRSLKNQKDADAEVLTDVLSLNLSSDRIQLRLTVGNAPEGLKAPVKFLGLSLADTRSTPPRLPPHRAVWGKSLAVPQRSQLDYPGGESSWCSPTSTSMILAAWAGKLSRPELDRPVPDVAAEVMDPNWPGTGNWPFNTAYAGSFPGMRAYVARFSDVSELEDWVDQGVPVALSVAYSVLKGVPIRSGSDGHLVVCVGFTLDGDAIVNDPGSRQQMRRVVPRQNLLDAWAHSHHTVYLIYPETQKVPTDRFGHWHSP